MKKITILAADKDVDASLKKLRELGVLHVKYLRQPGGESVSVLGEKLGKINKALSYISSRKDCRDSPCSREKVKDYLDEINRLELEKKSLSIKVKRIQDTLAWYESWGVFSLNSVSEIISAGIKIELYETNKSHAKELLSREDVFLINRDKDTVRLSRVGEEKDSSPFRFARKIEFPDKDFFQAMHELKDMEGKKAGIESRLDELAGYKESYELYKKEIEKEIQFARVKTSMASEQGFKYLQGFCPEKAVPAVIQAGEEQGWGLFVQKPEEKDLVPTLLENPWFIRIISPLFKFMETFPGYREYDVSPWFLIFFSLFFAMIIGDAGYGLIFFSLAWFVRRKNPNLPGEPFSLIYVLSGAAIIWGALTGTWFGWEGAQNLPLIRHLIINNLNSFAEANQKFIMGLCFLIGAVHLTLAHLIQGAGMLKSKRFLSQTGWILILWVMFFVTGTLVLNRPVPRGLPAVLIAGTLLVAFFSQPGRGFRGITKGFLVSLANMPLTVINFFADILSYLRLFAVGYASVMVAVSFNEMASQIGAGSVLGKFAAVLILFLGHSLNILLGVMSVLVHGVRLNTLEFSSHLGMEWKGIEYKPFK